MLEAPPPPVVRTGSAGRLADTLAGILSEQVHLTIHDNRSTMISFRRREGRLYYRVHHMFLEAPETVVQALAEFAGPVRGRAAGERRRTAGTAIDAFVRHNRTRISPARTTPLRAQGVHHDLEAIYRRLNAEHFDGAVDARIGWGWWRGGGRRRTIKTGVYVHDSRTIRIHPTLDRAEVPEFYVAAVIFHEMLHQVIPVQSRNGRRMIHGPAFRERERTFPDHLRAKAWEGSHLAILLSPRHRDRVE
jgi:hypothetical protein